MVFHQFFLGLGQTDLPWHTGMMDGALRRGAGTAVIARDQDDLRAGLGYAAGHGAHAMLRNQLDRHARLGIGVLQVIDQLRQIFDRINVMMGRRRDQRHARRGMTRLGDPGVYLATWQMSAFSRLCALRHLDLDLIGTA